MSIAVYPHPALVAAPEPALDPGPHLRLVPPPAPGDHQLALPLQAAALGGDTSDPALVDRASTFVRALVEIVEGRRPLLQLAPWVNEAVYDQVMARRAIRLRRSRSLGRSRVLSVHVSCPVADGAEVSARVDNGRRCRAIALRLDQRPDARGRERWRCTALTWG